MKICNGLRPKCDYKIPQLIVDIINQCWDADPLKRPNADEIKELMYSLYCDINLEKRDSIIYWQVKKADEINKKLSSTVQLPLTSTNTLSYTSHSQAIYTSRLLDYKNLPEPKNVDNSNGI
ncbi:hypothetical protein GLOIN_2v1536430, partial [Rhizophagus irregularis DAOM 181602=DAOM 197198]